MFRRRLLSAGAVAAGSAVCSASRWVAMNKEVRDQLTQHLTSLKEECKGQSLDLADMGDASKAATRAFQEAVQKSHVEDAQFKGKIATLSASVKAYNTRLNNLQNEARSIQAEVDTVLKLLWGTENPQGASFSKPPPAPSTAATSQPPESSGDGFDVEPPVISRILEREPTPKVEKVVAERVVEDKKHSNGEASQTKQEEQEIEVETIEIEVEPADGNGSSASPSGGSAEAEDPVDTMKITDITKELYERGVNFADCLDARSLRQRYRDVLSGKISSGYAGGAAKTQASKAYTEPLNPNGPGNASGTQPRTPPRPQQYQQQQPNTIESGLASDPYPNAERKMVDPMKRVWEIKQEIATEKGVDPSSVDLWSGKTKLDDSKRLYDYPSIQNYPIEVRQKGDIPR